MSTVTPVIPRTFTVRRVPNRATPPAEVYAALKEAGLQRTDVDRMGWLARPCSVDGPPMKPVSIFQAIAPFIGNQLLTRSIPTMDLDSNGCLNHCQMCFMDSQTPSRQSTFESVGQLFDNPGFLDMIHVHSERTLRLGASGDLLTHPWGIEIIKMVLAKTKSIDDAAQTKWHGNDVKARSRTSVITNFRPRIEQKFKELIQLVQENPDRLKVVISLPCNVKTGIHEAFLRFIGGLPDIFHNREDFQWPSGFPCIESSLENLRVNDVRHGPGSGYFSAGRILSPALLTEVGISERDINGERSYEPFSSRGLGKVYLNAEGLWLYVYTTQYESYTSRAFTKITPENLPLLTRIPYHYDYWSPPNWPGKDKLGRGGDPEINNLIAHRLWCEFTRGGKTPPVQPVSVVVENPVLE